MDKPTWRAGFELEVILGDLGDPRFEYCNDDPMDTASPEFCRAVAKRLTELTDYQWRASSEQSKAKGFLVVPEYGLDPLNWYRGMVAGVELITPPLPLQTADTARRQIAEAVEALDGDPAFLPDEVAADCAWHINIDSPDVRLSAGRYAACVDELVLLNKYERLFTEYTGLQRHAYGPTLLRHLRQDSEADLLERAGLENLLIHRSGRSKQYAANFAKEVVGYLELRHFPAWLFFGEEPLADILAPITKGLEVWPSQTDGFDDRLIKRFVILADWLKEERFQIDVRMNGYGFMFAEGDVYFHDEPLAHLVFNGTGHMVLFEKPGRPGSVAIYDIAYPDVGEAVALMALDLAELKLAGERLGPIANSAFKRGVDRIVRRLAKAGLTPLSHDQHLTTIANERAARLAEIEANRTKSRRREAAE